MCQCQLSIDICFADKQAVVASILDFRAKWSYAAFGDRVALFKPVTPARFPQSDYRRLQWEGADGRRNHWECLPGIEKFN